MFLENAKQKKARENKKTSVAVNIKPCKLPIKGNKSDKKVSTVGEKINSLRHTSPE